MEGAYHALSQPFFFNLIMAHLISASDQNSEGFTNNVDFSIVNMTRKK